MSRWGGWLFRGFALVAFATIAMLALRESAARAPRTHALAGLAASWPTHPAVVTERMMIEAAVAARSNRTLDDAQRSALRELMRKSPLAPAPFLLEGAAAQLAGDTERALRLYRAARLRDPRDSAARVLLADLELRSGLVEQGLANLVAISRIEVHKATPIVPALVSYARTPGAAEKVREVFARNPELAGAVLVELAADPSNAELIASLAPPGSRRTPWQERLVESNLQAGDVAAARRLWLRFNKIDSAADEIPFNPRFMPLAAKPPFNWAPGSGNGGLTEFKSGGGLSVVHFGRERMILARQLVVLDPGRYLLETRLDRWPDPGRLEWRLQCIGSDEVAIVPVDGRPRPVVAAPACRGYWLELHAVPDETERQSERTVRQVRLRKVA